MTKSAGTGERSPLSGTRRLVAIASVLAAMAAAVLDAASVNVALPAISSALREAPGRTIWIVIAYQAALVTGLLPAAALGERFGYRSIFMAGLALFIVSAGFALFAPGLGFLIGARIAQGLGAAAIMALGIALLRQTVRPCELGSAIGWNAMTVAVFTAAGPAIGAGLLSLGEWRLLFAGTIPLGIVAILASLALPRVAGASPGLDRTGLMLFLAIVPAFVAAAAFSASGAVSIALAAIGFAIAFYLVRRDSRRASPFLPLDLIRNRSFANAVAASICCFAGQGLGMIALPFVLHARFGASVLETGVWLTPWPLAVLLTTPITTRLLRRVPPSLLCAAGGVCLSAGLGGLALLSADDGLWPHLLFIATGGIGFGLFQTPNNRNMFLAAPVERSASAGGLQGTARLIGQTLGGLIAAFLMSLFPIADAIRAGFGLAALWTLAAGAISWNRRSGEDDATTPGADLAADDVNVRFRHILRQEPPVS
ncbi:MFS transporter [Sphingopyxis sp.]|uniref:MFS transporter n=1 Tax=Sphingopyxis sp. TaxID=1908224 RepID=UPI003BACF30D